MVDETGAKAFADVVDCVVLKLGADLDLSLNVDTVHLILILVVVLGSFFITAIISSGCLIPVRNLKCLFTEYRGLDVPWRSCLQSIRHKRLIACTNRLD